MTFGTRRTQLTVAEVIATLKRSNFPIVLTEGDDDYTAYRVLERKLSDVSASFMPVGGRDCLLAVFKRRLETGRANQIAFIADRDLWVMRSIPPEYVDVSMVFTDGYSIENDLFQDGKILNMFSPQERMRFDADLREFLRWYAFAVGRLLEGNRVAIDHHPEKVLKDSQPRTDFLADVEYNEPEQVLYDDLILNYRRLLRGKSLMQLVMRQLSYGSRRVKHQNDALMEICSISGGLNMAAIISAIINYLRPG